MKRIMTVTLISIMVVIFMNLFLLGCNEQEKVFRIGFIPAENAVELTPKAEALGKFLEQEMSMDVEILVPTTYEPLMEGLRFGHLDAAYMDGGPGWLAYKTSGAEVVLAEIKEGSPFYYAEIFARADSDITSLHDVLGKKIAFTSWTGSSGFVMPIGTLIERGLIAVNGNDFPALEQALQQSFANTVISGGYKQSMQLLLDGTVDVVGGSHDSLEKYVDEGDRKKLKSVERLGKVPSHPVVVRKDLSPEIRDKFVAAMLKLNQPEHIQILKDLYGVDGLVTANTQDHLGEFGPKLDALVGLHDKVLKK